MVASKITRSAATPEWIDVGASAVLRPNEVIRFDQGDQTFAVYRLADGSVHASDGLCTHGRTPLCNGLVIDGQIECPKHNGRFDIATGRAITRPATVELTTYEARDVDGRIRIRIRGF